MGFGTGCFGVFGAGSLARVWGTAFVGGVPCMLPWHGAACGARWWGAACHLRSEMCFGGTGVKCTDSYCLQGVCEQLCCSLLCSLIAHLACCSLPAFMQGWGGVICVVALRGGPGQFLLLAFWASMGGVLVDARLMWGMKTFKIKTWGLGRDQ